MMSTEYIRPSGLTAIQIAQPMSGIAPTSVEAPVLRSIVYRCELEPQLTPDAYSVPVVGSCAKPVKPPGSALGFDVPIGVIVPSVELTDANVFCCEPNLS